jgi:RecB family exonuclease
VAEAARGRPDAFPERFAELETERLAELAAQWLALERQRAPFTVAGRESRAAVAVGGLHLDVRLDRVDRLADGRLLLLDYKTGRAEVGAWAGERPDEPQLPLYAVGAGEGVAGVAFARLKAGELGFAGVAAADGVAPGVTSAEAAKAFDGAGWEDLLGRWRTVLDGLGAEIRGGAAAVTPRDGPAQTCAYCHLGAVCRIQEHTDATAEPVGEETGRAGDD